MPQTNYFGQLLLDLQERIKTLVPEIKFIDQDFGQLEITDEEYRPAISFPGVLIDFVDADYNDLSDNAQTGEVMVLFRLAFNPYSSSSQLTPIEYREKALKYYLLEQKLFEALQGFYTEYTQPFSRRKASSEKGRVDGLRVRNLMFTTALEDYSATAQNEILNKGLSIEFEED